jgi:hypothetical protein
VGNPEIERLVYVVALPAVSRHHYDLAVGDGVALTPASVDELTGLNPRIPAVS